MEEKKHYWCESCGIPLLNSVCNFCGNKSKTEIPTDTKPVFHKEYNIYYDTIKKDVQINERYYPKILFRNRNYLISDISLGKPHFQIKVKNNNSNSEEGMLSFGEFGIVIEEKKLRGRSRIKNYFLNDSEYMKKLIRANEKYLIEIEREAIDFIKRVSKEFKDHFQICSFSGGKDSTVTANLVKDAIGKVPVVYSDTGIEFELTKKYVREFGNTFGELIYLDKQIDFEYMCDQLGPPSRTMRWCCFTNKGAPLSKFYAEMEHNQVLSFDGIRARESHSRSLLSRERDNTKYEKQFSAYPIIEWTTLEVWLYILWKKLPYNPIYDYGFARVGCWACPNNTKFDWFLAYKAYPEMTKSWFKYIYDYGEEQNKKMGEDDRKYDLGWTEDGHWKKRRVKYQDKENLKSFTNDDNLNYDIKLNYPIRPSLKEFLKVFGDISSDNEVVNIKANSVDISFKENGNEILFHFNNEQNEKKLKRLIIRQINKSYNCINCGACVGSCPKGAISIKSSNSSREFAIDSNKCVHCLICTGTKYLEMSCIAIHYKEDRIYIKLNSI